MATRSGVQRAALSAAVPGNGGDARSPAQRPKRRKARSERCMVTTEGETAGGGGGSGPPRMGVRMEGSHRHAGCCRPIGCCGSRMAEELRSENDASFQFKGSTGCLAAGYAAARSGYNSFLLPAQASTAVLLALVEAVVPLSEKRGLSHRL